MAPKYKPVAPPPTPPLDDLPTFFSNTTCLRRGLCPVTSLREQGAEVIENHSLYYEQHVPPSAKDNDAELKKLNKVVFIVGLNTSSFSWDAQVRWFGKEESRCTALVFDNRGVGNSGYPRGPYTTSGMAEDVICLLDYLGWTGERELNVVGISLGGMIAQELTWRIPKRVASLLLAVTTPGGHIWNNFPPFKGVKSLTKLMFTQDPVQKIPIVLDLIFPQSWLSETAVDDPNAPLNGNTEDNRKGKKNSEVENEVYIRRTMITKPQKFIGHISQMAAGLTHRVTPDRLAYISANVPKIAIVTGDDDHLVRPLNSVRILEGMQGGLNPKADPDVESKRVELLQWKDTGHAINTQHRQRFNNLVERCIQEGKTLLENGFRGRDI